MFLCWTSRNTFFFHVQSDNHMRINNSDNRKHMFDLTTQANNSTLQAGLIVIKMKLNALSICCWGSALLYLAIPRYNQRAVSVLSYVSQFAVSDADLSSLQQTALHKVFRLPPNSLSREVSTNVGLFTGIDPISLPEYCAAVRFRFAFSEQQYLFDLYSRVRVRVLDCLPLVELTGFFLPKGSSSSHSILIKWL